MKNGIKSEFNKDERVAVVCVQRKKHIIVINELLSNNFFFLLLICKSLEKTGIIESFL